MIEYCNEIVYQVYGDDIIEVLPYCTIGFSRVIEIEFKFLRGISPEDCSWATLD